MVLLSGIAETKETIVIDQELLVPRCNKESHFQKYSRPWLDMQVEYAA